MRHARSLSLFALGFAVAVAACAEGSGIGTVVEGTSAGDGTSSGDPISSGGGGGTGGSGTSGGTGGGSDASAKSDGAPDANPKDGGDAGGGSDAGGGFDAGGGSDGGSCTKTPPSLVCGLVAQCGCAASSTCVVSDLNTGAVSCTAAGSGALGSACATHAQCATGLGCVFDACRPHCPTSGAACAGAGTGVCFSPEKPGGGTTPNLSVCSVKCDPRVPSTVCGSNGCLWFASEKESDCRLVGTGGLFSSCSNVAQCAPGLTCANHPFFGYECEKWCRIGGSDCGIFETCTDVLGANAPVISGVKLGVCQD